MVTTVASRYNRTRYPLAPGSIAKSITIQSSKDGLDKATQPSKPSEDSKTVVPWYHAVTELREKPVLEPSAFDSLTSRLEETEIPASDSSLTAVSWSRRSSVPLLSDSPDSRNDRGKSTLIQNDVVQTQDTSAPTMFSNKSQDSLSQTSVRSDSSSRPSSAGSLDHTTEIPVKRTRTLRRTPRSRRIVAPIPASEVGPPPSFMNKTVDTDESSSPSVGPWKRLSYPLRTIDNAEADSTEAPSSLHEQTPPQEQSGKSLHPKPQSTIIESGQLYSSEAEFVRDEHPLSLSKPEVPYVKAAQGQDVSQCKQVAQTQVGSFRQKRRYPLQSPVSQIDLHVSPSPPPSPLGTSAEHFDEDLLADQDDSTEPRIYRQPGYPLQMPTPIFSLIPSEERPLPLTPKVEPYPIPAIVSAVTKGQGKPWGMAELGSPRSAMTANIIEAQKYPVQVPAVVAEIQPLDPVEPRNNTVAEVVPQQKVDTSIAKKSLKRKLYPLQSPASSVNLKSPQLPQTANEISSSVAEMAKGTALHSDKGTTFEDNQDTRTPAPRRTGYPLQMPGEGASENNITKIVKELQVRDSTQIETAGLDSDLYDPPQRFYQRQKYPLHPARHFASAQPQSRETEGAQAELIEKKKPSNALKAGLTAPTNSLTTSTSVTRSDRLDNKQSMISEVMNRSAYPLQVAIPEPQRPASSIPTIAITPGSPDKEKASGGEERDARLAKKVINQWRRQVYPVQSPDKASPFPRAVTPQPPWDSLHEQKKDKIHLPKNLHAVRDTDHMPSKGRTLVVCLDGTGDKFDDDNSNIVHIVSALKKDDPSQVTYYQAGIGTYGEGGLSGGVTAAMDMAVGAGLGLHVRDAYHFLMHTYKEGDRICIFGFSRGAYTARCVAGMIHKVGLLPPRNIQQIPFAYEFYANDTAEGWKSSRDFKKAFSIDVNVHFLGCFDSVASVGFIPRTLPLSTTPTNKPHYFRHAMALDERRAKFKVARHQRMKIKDVKENRSNVSATAHMLYTLLPFYRDQNDAPPEASDQNHYRTKHHPNVTDEEYERLVAEEEAFDTDVLEVWFAGAHADVGGGAVKNDERHKLAQIPLRWMIRQAFECNTGIIFKTKALAEFGLDVHTLWPRYQRLKAPSHGPPPSVLEKYSEQLPPRQVRRSKLKSVSLEGADDDFYHLEHPTDEDWTPEQIEDYYDAMSPMNDQLIQAPNWWILELWPVQIKLPKGPGEVDIIVAMNMGRYRAAEEAQPLMHWTVRHRMAELGYKLGVRTAPQITWKEVV